MPHLRASPTFARFSTEAPNTDISVSLLPNLLPWHWNRKENVKVKTA